MNHEMPGTMASTESVIKHLSSIPLSEDQADLPESKPKLFNRPRIPGRTPSSPRTILRREMMHRWLSVEEVAIAAGLSPATIEAILDGTQQMTPAIAKGLSKATGTSVEFWVKLGAGHSGQI